MVIFFFFFFTRKYVLLIKVTNLYFVIFNSTTDLHLVAPTNIPYNTKTQGKITTTQCDVCWCFQEHSLALKHIATILILLDIIYFGE